LSIYNAEKRQKLMRKYLRQFDVTLKDRAIILQKKGFIFRFHMFQTNIEISFSECFECPLDCNKFLDFYLEKAELSEAEDLDLEKEDLLLLAHIKDILENEFSLDYEMLHSELKKRIHILKFGMIGFDQVGKSTLFETIDATPKKVANLINSYVKEITSFPPLFVKIYDYGAQVMENFISKTPAPLLLEKLRHFYLYIVVTDSTTQNVMKIKTQILPKLKRLSPFAAIIVLANKQDLPNRLSPQLIEKILGVRTYPISAIKSDSIDFFKKLLNEIILLRLEQMREYNCPFIESPSPSIKKRL